MILNYRTGSMETVLQNVLIRPPSSVSSVYLISYSRTNESYSAVICGLISNEFYSIPSRPLDRSLLTKYEEKLVEWESNLPPIVQLRNGGDEVTPPEVITMHAQLWNCRILLHRPL